MKRYEKHIFICENKREEGNPRGSCADKGSLSLKSVFKSRIKQLGLNTEVRANSAGCLDACEFGPTVVIYPEQVWYSNVKVEDINEIIEEHVIKGNHVVRLMIKDKKYNKDENR